MSFRARQPRVRDRGHLDWIKQLPCLACAVEGKTTYGVDPAHIRHAFRGWPQVGGGEKPSDDRVAPMCRFHHDDQHAHPPEQVWWAKLGVNPVALCADLVSARAAHESGEEVIFEHAKRAKRTAGLIHRASGLPAAMEAGPTPVTVSAHLGPARDARGNVEVIFLCAGEGKELISQRAFVTPDAVKAESEVRK